MLRIYFGNRSLLLTGPAEPIEGNLDPGTSIRTAQELKEAALDFHRGGPAERPLRIEEGHDWTPLLENAFTLIRTGGGVVRRADGSLLLIRRRGVWDLPKGWVDPGETLPACAAREVEEETGVRQLNVLEPLQVTYHTYEHEGGLVLKENHWFLMETAFEGDLVPQTEESISSVSWVPAGDLAPILADTHPSIRDVLEAYLRR